jgi:hypothetical protein
VVLEQVLEEQVDKVLLLEHLAQYLQLQDQELLVHNLAAALVVAVLLVGLMLHQVAETLQRVALEQFTFFG